jgi:MbtH protein
MRYRVVVNDEEQYSIWPVGLTLPAGWHEVGISGGESECLEHIATVWTDLRPKSLREAVTSVTDATAGTGTPDA